MIAVASTVKTTELRAVFPETVRIQCLESVGIPFGSPGTTGFTDPLCKTW